MILKKTFINLLNIEFYRKTMENVRIRIKKSSSEKIVMKELLSNNQN